MIKSCIAAICHATITSMGRFIVLMKTVVSEFRVIAAPIRIACTASFGRLVSALVLIRSDVVRFVLFAAAIWSVGLGSVLFQHEMSTCLAWYERQDEKSTIQDIRTFRVLFEPKCSWPETTSRFWREGRPPRHRRGIFHNLNLERRQVLGHDRLEGAAPRSPAQRHAPQRAM